MTNNIFTAKCPECGGSGRIKGKNCEYRKEVTMMWNKKKVYRCQKHNSVQYRCGANSFCTHVYPKCCPTCQGSGRIMLVVECRDRMICDMDMDAMCSGVPVDGKCIGAYRPLTVAEVEELIKEYKMEKRGIEVLIDMIKEEDTYFKVQPVHIRAYKENSK